MQEESWIKETLAPRSLALITVGTLLFAFAMNVFVTPLGLYSGGFLGIAQLIREFLSHVLGMDFDKIDVAGILYFLMSVPFLIMSYSRFGKPFFYKTLICTGLYSFFLTVIVGPETPVLDDALSSCVVGGLIAGLGAGLTLVSGGCGGGEEILCLFLTKKYPMASVGRVSILINIFVFGCCAICFNVRSAIYSVIYSVIANLALDKVHLQNITMDVMIISKKEGLEQLIFDTVHRGVTKLSGEGGYTKEKANVFITVVSKNEAHQIKRVVREFDPHAFIIVHDDILVEGNFEVRL